MVNLWETLLSPERRKELDQLFGTRTRNDNEALGAVDIKHTMVGKGCHQGEISTLETCLQRPILLTCSTTDQTVRIWDYISNTQVLYKSFVLTDSSTGKVASSPLVCAALHPSGYYLAVGLID